MPISGGSLRFLVFHFVIAGGRRVRVMILCERMNGKQALSSAGMPDRAIYRIRATAMKFQNQIYNCPAVEGVLGC